MTLEEFKKKIEELARKYIPFDQADNMIWKFKEKHRNEDDIQYTLFEAYFNYFGFDAVVQFYDEPHNITFICDEKTSTIVLFDDDLEKAFSHFARYQETNCVFANIEAMNRKEVEDDERIVINV